ncbi:uncharacterized protein K444DRAFT_156192 [Hyaloscypha bicolor E]|uniref:Uncharacterized protein n=1 Tax=Hyaloscypha bicolor E TaxID=1095630 RepID=A0A2J6TSE4_9HELO|nr:uncharacterized protein K444DRAFT_156192 [Hyaloscypha bicolor E]PMD65898.1 hypothetical protein K444DRAFT_156192 [Hyaloscypha bicolor E]
MPPPKCREIFIKAGMQVYAVTTFLPFLANVISAAGTEVGVWGQGTSLKIISLGVFFPSAFMSGCRTASSTSIIHK